jgi:hypothetical protein
MSYRVGLLSKLVLVSVAIAVAGCGSSGAQTLTNSRTGSVSNSARSSKHQAVKVSSSPCQVHKRHNSNEYVTLVACNVRAAEAYNARFVLDCAGFHGYISSPCRSDIRQYRTLLLVAKIELHKVWVPSFLAQANKTLRLALKDGLTASKQALVDIRNKNLKGFLEVIGGPHLKAGEELALAYSQAINSWNRVWSQHPVG